MLPHNAQFYTSEEITERMSRRVSRARHKLLGVSLRLEKAGYMLVIPELGTVETGHLGGPSVVWDEERIKEQRRLNLELEASLTTQELDDSDAYQLEAICAVMKSWDNGPITPDSLLDLHPDQLAELSAAANAVIDGTQLDTGPSPDPLAPGADSPG